ncbi:MAG: hypothetical protein EA396_11075 [Anaerolineaceae bacterium]|nr:MAG: hypothetical protein EA396_11075 [Anaerolineaceae bacterium]
MSIDLEDIRSRNPIDVIVNERFSLKQSGSRFIGVEHDSLVVVPSSGFYFWNSRNEHGDVFDFVGRYHLNYGDGWNSANGDQFMQAVRYLAERAGIRLEHSEDYKQSPAWAERQLVSRLHEALANHQPAVAYVVKRRGWQPATVKAARLGFMPQDKRALLTGIADTLPETWKRVIERFPADMIVYVHMQGGRLVYLSGRSIEGKRHYNPPADIIGERRPYCNHVYRSDADRVVIVEGQADALTFAEWGIPAVALGGMKASDAFIETLAEHRRVFIALDNTDQAYEQARLIAQAVGQRAYLSQLPGDVKDANDWLQRDGTAEAVADMLNRSQSWIIAEVNHAANLEGLAREDALRDLFRHAGSLDSFTLAQFKDAMGRVGIKARMFNEMLKSTDGRDDARDDDPKIFDDSIPVLSPAQGYRREIGMFAVALRERTKENRIAVQPYLVTSTRELKRVGDEQIIPMGGGEVALKALPEGSEFLMRWKYGDIQRFLQGETVAPGGAFNAVHQQFTRFIDFRSWVESSVMALWAIGTYFYTMFPAYPYLALNGPKNSGKSTVLRVLQPIAFNMISTSDPTGPSMFRMIHYTSCTVGIDEAERYHNPRDPGMQQIRQLLNSGYKSGMPAIRLVGEDMKPQAFDVYSPKIMAAIMGLEDILASRCIAIPMRRTDRKMPLIPPDFDGASIRHQLYTLALSYHQSVYRNFFERPELHKLTNRSGELWQPLIALAAFFEEEGGVDGLLDAISQAAEWDEQLSEGKSLSDREEAVLQALEIMTRGSDGESWIKGAELRSAVGGLLGIATEQMGNAQWIGHILNRLQLTDKRRRRHHAGGKMYGIEREQVADMMRRYDVPKIENDRS